MCDATSGDEAGEGGGGDGGDEAVCALVGGADVCALVGGGDAIAGDGEEGEQTGVHETVTLLPLSSVQSLTYQRGVPMTTDVVDL